MFNTSSPSGGARAGALVALGAGVLLVASAGPSTTLAQVAPPNGPRQVDPRWHALTGATLVQPSGTVEDATIVLRDGLVVAVTPGGAPPAGARVWECAGLRVYPGLIDAHVPVEAPAPDAKSPGAHWNAKVTPQRTALDGGLDADLRKTLREMGFTAAAIAPKGGVLRGQGAVISLADPAEEASAERHGVITPVAFHEVGFETSGFGRDEYPSSEMGAIALIRQTLSDAQWHALVKEACAASPGSHEPAERSDALDALSPGSTVPLLFDATDELQAIRAARIAREFDRPAIILGSGLEFRRLGAVSAGRLPLIVPLNFPEAPKINSVADAEAVSLRELMTWEQAPTNPRRLRAAGAEVSLTTDRLKKRSDFMPNLRKAVEHGLSEEDALAMLTTNPARTLGLSGRLGAVAPGAIASLVVVEGSLFDEKGRILDVWVGGERHEINQRRPVEFAGVWDYTFGAGEAHDASLVIEVADDGKVSVKIEDKAALAAAPAEEAPVEDEADEGAGAGDAKGAKDKGAIKARNVKVVENRLSYLVDLRDDAGTAVVSAVRDGQQLLGTLLTPDGQAVEWTGVRRGDVPAGDEGKEEEGKDEEKKKPEVPEALPTPFGPYGLTQFPAQDDVLVVRNCTLWTCGPAGVVTNGVLVVEKGKVTYAGAGASAPRVKATREIDGAGRHVTPGLIDCHSHTGISGGVNEGTQAVTSEVRIFDVIDPDDINWWRELAGGLTGANQLHGSANPIGGQNSVVKIRWGVAHPDQMRLEGATPGIKFALGENVKQSNWGDNNTTRYPQTRMGVETIIRDRFIAAREYARGLESAGGARGGLPAQRDLELEALAEILRGERLVHCHSYRQDEILMLCRVAAEFGFTIGTFQHVLEGYKVADAIRDNALGGSTFSDWWAYKFEVYDAIPENGAIMHDVGVCVSFNSDSDELARRLNTEAAKAVRYGGVSPEEALKFVTLNPAKQLKIDRMTGSLEKGKDADFVIWSGDPLSVYTRCEATYIDGREFFSLALDETLRERASAERARLIQKVVAEGAKGGDKGEGRGGRPGRGEGRPVADALTSEEASRLAAMERLYDEMLRAGLDPDAHRCGECGVLDLHKR